MVLAVPITEQVQLVVDVGDLFLVDLGRAEPGPVATAIGACAHAFATVRAGQHGPGDELDSRHAGGRCAHQLRGHGLVATAYENDRIHGLRANHFLGIHRHQVAQVHGCRRRKAFVNGDGREVHRQAAAKHHTALHRFNQLRHVAVARVIRTARIDDTDHRPVQGLVGITGALDESLAQEQRKVLVAV
jgi:hypothetical protein